MKTVLCVILILYVVGSVVWPLCKIWCYRVAWSIFEGRPAPHIPGVMGTEYYNEVVSTIGMPYDQAVRKIAKAASYHFGWRGSLLWPYDQWLWARFKRINK